MDIDYYGQLEIWRDEFKTRLDAIEGVLLKLPNVAEQSDPSRPFGIVVEPAPLIVDGL